MILDFFVVLEPVLDDAVEGGVEVAKHVFCINLIASPLLQKIKLEGADSAHSHGDIGGREVAEDFVRGLVVEVGFILPHLPQLLRFLLLFILYDHVLEETAVGEAGGGEVE